MFGAPLNVRSAAILSRKCLIFNVVSQRNNTRRGYLRSVSNTYVSKYRGQLFEKHGRERLSERERERESANARKTVKMRRQNDREKMRGENEENREERDR